MAMVRPGNGLLWLSASCVAGLGSRRLAEGWSYGDGKEGKATTLAATDNNSRCEVV